MMYKYKLNVHVALEVAPFSLSLDLSLSFSLVLSRSLSLVDSLSLALIIDTNSYMPVCCSFECCGAS